MSQAYVGTDSDGSPEKPWRTIQDGVNAAAPRAIVAIAEGRYTEDVRVREKPVRLWGRCPRLVQITGTGVETGAVWIEADASDAEVRGLSISGQFAGVVVLGASGVVLDSIWVRDTQAFGLFFGRYVDRSHVTIQNSLVSRTVDVGVFLDGAAATIVSSVVRDTQPTPQGYYGWGIGVTADTDAAYASTLTLKGSLIEQNHEAGIYVSRSAATIEGSVVRRNLPSRDGLGLGIDVVGGANAQERGTLTVRSSLIAENHEIGVHVSGADAVIVGTVVRDALPRADGRYGRGIDVEHDDATGQRSTLTLASSYVGHNQEINVFIAGADAAIEASVVGDVLPDRPPRLGMGITVQSSNAGARGALTMTSSLVTQNLATNLGIKGGDVLVESCVVRGSPPDVVEALERGIHVETDVATSQRGTLTVRRSIVTQNRLAGVIVIGADATIEESLIQDNLPDAARKFGRGINVEGDADTGQRGAATVRRSVIADNEDVGVFISASDVTVEGSLVRGTRAGYDGSFGDGILGFYDGKQHANVTVVDTQISSNTRSGLFFDASDGRVSNTLATGGRFGVVLNGLPTPTIADDNVFEGNERERYDGGNLPIPSVMPPLP